jgi:hypothetical protein
MNYKRRIERIEKRTPQHQGETWAELLDRLGMGCLKKDIEAVDSFIDVVVDQGARVVCRR